MYSQIWVSKSQLSQFLDQHAEDTCLDGITLLDLYCLDLWTAAFKEGGNGIGKTRVEWMCAAAAAKGDESEEEGMLEDEEDDHPAPAAAPATAPASASSSRPPSAAMVSRHFLVVTLESGLGSECHQKPVTGTSICLLTLAYQGVQIDAMYTLWA